jgi:hypothetical protein
VNLPNNNFEAHSAPQIHHSTIEQEHSPQTLNARARQSLIKVPHSISRVQLPGEFGLGIPPDALLGLHHIPTRCEDDLVLPFSAVHTSPIYDFGKFLRNHKPEIPLVELMGFEPTTSSMPLKRSPN